MWTLVAVLLAFMLVGGCGDTPMTPPAPDAGAALESNGCNQRDDILMRDLQRGEPWTVVQQGRCGHDVVAGTWIDAYTSQQLTFTNLKDGTQASAIPIDHVVALASAWRYGASGWTANRRLEFANDLDNLQPTSRSVNAAKGSKDAAAWRPKRAFQCAYATSYVGIKAKYDLPVDQSAKSALQDMIHTCAGS